MRRSRSPPADRGTAIGRTASQRSADAGAGDRGLPPRHNSPDLSPASKEDAGFPPLGAPVSSTVATSDVWKLNLHIAVGTDDPITGGDDRNGGELGADLWFATPCEAVCLIPDRLYYMAAKDAPAASASRVYLNIDDDLLYVPFFSDFGPLNLGKVYRYCQRVNAMLEAPENRGKAVYHISSLHPHRRANAIFLAACYAVACLRKSPEEAVAPFIRSGPPIIAFRDASFGLCTYQLTVLDAVRGLHKAAAVGAFSFDSFDIDAYERLEQFKNGDMNWLIPGKFLAFSGPLDDPKPLPGGGYTFRPHDYVPIFKAIGVTMVVRLNKGHYDRTTFVENGIKHVDLYYPDGSVPSDEILQEFLRIAEREPGGIAVHCKAGLGRTGTCIGAYVMKHFGFTAKECIGWFRICRPGSVLGPQQYYMERIQAAMWAQGKAMRDSHATSNHALQLSTVHAYVPRMHSASKRRPGRHVDAIESAASIDSPSGPSEEHGKGSAASRVGSATSHRSGAKSASKSRFSRSPAAVTSVVA